MNNCQNGSIRGPPAKMALKFRLVVADIFSMDQKKGLTRGVNMIQWIGVIIALLTFTYNGVKDYQKGEIKLPELPQKEELTKPVYPVQYCLMAYDPNLRKVFYQHENGQWYDFPPKIREYPNQGQEALGDPYGTQGVSGHSYGQPPQAIAYPQGY